MINLNQSYKHHYSFLLIVSNIIGEAINNDEYVPTNTPTIKANINPLITSPPKINITSKTKSC